VAAAALGCVAVAPVLGQEVSGRSGLTVTPTFSVTETITDNHRNGSEPGHSESITTISPGLRASSRSGRVQGAFDYGLVGVLYGRDSQENSIQHRLSSTGRAELIQNHLDLYASASIFRQPISAFGQQSANGGLTELNQSEVRTYSIQPVLRGVLAGVVGVQASLNASGTNSDAEINSASTGATLTMSSVSTGALFGWSLTGSRQISNFDGGRETTTDRVVASVLFRPQPELQLTLRGGPERTDLASVEQRQSSNWGAELTWIPSLRTRVMAGFDRRAFGNGHNIALEHRMRRSVWRYADSRSVSDGSGQTNGGSVRAYDLFFELFASLEPDPVLRDALVRSFLERNNIPLDAPIGGGFLSAAPTVQRRQELSLALSGLRTTFVAAAFLTDSRRADTVSTAADDLSNGALRQRGLSATVSHRLTPRQTLSLLASTQRSRSEGAAGRTGLDSLSVSWSTRLTERGNLSLSLRHSEYDETTPYTENALTAAFSTRF
jgi:uncharacterized protein (PEP-CTERM system associated)